MSQILIENLAGRRYRIAFDEAAVHEPGGKGRLRAQYQIIPCKYGEIYQHGRGTLAWYCTSGRVKERVRAQAPDWLTLEVDCDGEGIFVFPAKWFPEVAKWARPRRRRVVSEKERQRLQEMGKAHQFHGVQNSTGAPDEEIPTSTEVLEGQREQVQHHLNC